MAKAKLSQQEAKRLMMRAPERKPAQPPKERLPLAELVRLCGAQSLVRL